MKYKIKDLMEEFKHLGCSVGDYGYPIIPDDEPIAIGEYYRKGNELRLEYIEKLKTATPEQKTILQEEYNAKQQKIEKDIEKADSENIYSKAWAIYNLIELAQKLHEMGFDVSEEMDSEQLSELFIALGGELSNTEYNIPETPETIKTIEAEINRLQKETHQAANPFTLLDTNEKKVEEFMLTNIQKIDELKKQLEEEIEKHPEYKAIKSVLDTIKAMEKLERYNSIQKTKGE